MGGAVKAITAVVGAVVGFIIGGPVGAIIGAGLGYASGDLVNAIINPGFNVPNTGFDGAIQQNQGVLVNKQGTNISLPVVYGKRRIGGARVFVSTEGETNEYLHIVLALAEGEINAIKEIYMDDVLCWSGTSSHSQRYESSIGKFTGLVTFETYHGTANQTAAPLTLGVGGWGNDHRLRGLAYISFRLKWLKVEKTEDQDKTPWANIPNITVVIEGKKIADATAFADSISRATAYGSETVTYNVNPINCLLDYLRNPIYGKGLSNDKINFKSFRDEATRWSKLADGSTATGDQFHECNAVIFTERSLMDNVKTFLFNCRAALPYQDGRFSVRVEDNRNDTSTYGATSTPVMTVGEDSIIGSINIESENAQGKYNRVVVTYMGGRQGEQLTNEAVEYTYPEAGSSLEAQYLAQDNDRLNELKYTLEHITQDSIAKKYAEVSLKKSRFRGKVLSFTGDASLHQLQVNDVFTMNYTGLGINGAFRVKSIQFNADYTFSIIAEEHNDLIYGGNVTPYRRRSPTVIYAGTTYPIYIDQNTGNVVHIGDKSNAPLPDNWVPPADVPPQYTTIPEKYTAAEIEAAIATGNVVAIIDGDIIWAAPEYLPKPVIKSATVTPTANGYVDVRVNIEPRTEPNIEATYYLRYDAATKQYWQQNPANPSTAAKDGYVLIPGINPNRTLNLKIQFQGKGGQLRETSAAVTVDFTGTKTNNILFQEL
jgi:hypothetical protein